MRRWIVLFLTLFTFGGCVRAAELIRVGINSSYAPFENVDDQGHLSGFDFDVVNAWAKNQRVQVKFVNLTWPRLLESLASGQVDMIVSAVAITAQRQKTFDFSRPYYYEPQVLLLPASRRVADVRRFNAIGVLTDSSAQGWLTRLSVPASALQSYDGLPPMIADLRAGKIQAAFGDQHAMRYAAALDPSLHLLRQPEFGMDAYAFVVRKGNHALQAQANRGLAALQASGALARLKQGYPGL